jgi:Na+-transporting NADH:ubiquinone oxidoreductase subunit A
MNWGVLGLLSTRIVRGLIDYLQGFMEFKSRRGVDVELDGALVQGAVERCSPSRCAILGVDVPGLRPEFRVAAGETVRTGQTVFVDRKTPDISFASPVTGVVTAADFGAQRTLGKFVIETTDDKPLDMPVPDAAGQRNGLASLLLASGLWPSFLARPFGRIPRPGSEPAAIFITAIDTNPLAADPATVLAPNLALFERGVEALAMLTDGPVFVCQGPGADLVHGGGQIRVVHFEGPHPSGLPGTHIHRLLPVSAQRTVWHIGYQDVVAIGDLLVNHRYRSERIIARGGPASAKPCLVETRLGASLGDIAKADGGADHAVLVSGSVLSGRKCDYLGRYHSQVTMLSPPGEPGGSTMLARLRRLAGQDVPRPLIPFEAFERAMPLDILPVPLLRALSVGDTESAVRLGCLELVEEDLALMSYLCPGRNDYGALLRRMLDGIAGESA